MAQIESGQKGGRSGNIELNLVPFIDLMSVLITFLLITAVWNQVSMIQIGTSLYAKKNEDAPPPVQPPEFDKVLKLDITAKGYILTVGKQKMSIALKDQKYDDQVLLEQLQRAKGLFPEKIDGIIAVSDELSYELLINSMDLFLQAGFTSISVATGGP